MQVAMEFKSAITFVDSIVEDGYEYIPAGVDETEFNSAFPGGYGRTQEEVQHEAILGRDDETVTVTWTPQGDLRDESASERYYEDLIYRVAFQKGGQTIVFSGTCDLYFRDTGGLWEVYRWIDNDDGSGNETWTKLRIEGGPAF